VPIDHEKIPRGPDLRALTQDEESFLRGVLTLYRRMQVDGVDTCTTACMSDDEKSFEYAVLLTRNSELMKSLIQGADMKTTQAHKC